MWSSDGVAGAPLTVEQQLERAIVAAQALAPKLPGYMNPGAMNPLKFQSIQEKRKLLWSGKKKVWNVATLFDYCCAAVCSVL